MKNIFIAFILMMSVSLSAQYTFTTIKKLDCTEVKSQDRTGTCWSFATASFLESEVMRKGKGRHDLSEMFVVRNVYRDKANNYILRQGKANFSQGSLSHDLINVAMKYGVVPEAVFNGKLDASARHDHSEMEAVLKGMLDGLNGRKKLSKTWRRAFDCVLDTYLGTAPEQFTYNGKSFTPKGFSESLEIDPEDYVSISSFTHHPFYRSFVLEIPDNYSNGSFINVPMEEMKAIVDNALAMGYSIAWDGDVSEKGFSAREGIAVLPVDTDRDDVFKNPAEEIIVTQEMRQDKFESYETTDDHLMHLVGKSKDQYGHEYYIIKNSWGEISDYKGFLHMSEAYFNMKTVAIMVHKDAIPKDIKSKIKML